MPKALCLISLVASILVAVLFLADAAMGMLGMADMAPLRGRQLTDGHRLRAPGCRHDLHELVDLSRATLTPASITVRCTPYDARRTMHTVRWTSKSVDHDLPTQPRCTIQPHHI